MFNCGGPGIFPKAVVAETEKIGTTQRRRAKGRNVASRGVGMCQKVEVTVRGGMSFHKANLDERKAFGLIDVQVARGRIVY